MLTCIKKENEHVLKKKKMYFSKYLNCSEFPFSGSSNINVYETTPLIVETQI